MMNNMIGNNIASIEKMTDIIGKKNSDNVDKMYNGKTFADIYNQKRSIEEVISDSDIKSSKGLKFSKHAGERLEQRDIRLSDEQMTRLEEGTEKAILKGIKESLVIVDDLSFIVNTRNRTLPAASAGRLQPSAQPAQHLPPAGSALYPASQTDRIYGRHSGSRQRNASEQVHEQRRDLLAPRSRRKDSGRSRNGERKGGYRTRYENQTRRCGGI